MTAREAYKRFELKLNKLDSADNIDISTGEFVLIFNEWQIKWYDNKFESKSSRFDIDEVQGFIQPDFKITSPIDKIRYSEFSMPDNYLDYISSYSLCDRGQCKGRLINNFEIKPVNTNDYLRDANNEPSFEYSETPIVLANNKIQVYRTDFVVKELYLTYYRYPVKIDIVGYKKIDGAMSVTIDPELQDEYVDQVIDLCVSDVQRITENGDGFQLSNNRVNNN